MQQANQVLRRSTRKRPTHPSFSSVFETPPLSSKKSRKTTSTCFSTNPDATLITLPSLVLKKLLLYLDVDTLESLSNTCSFFDSLIAGRFLTSINFPFSSEFTAELAATKLVEKKPLLKLKCKKSRDDLFSINLFPGSFHPISMQEIIVGSRSNSNLS